MQISRNDGIFTSQNRFDPPQHQLSELVSNALKTELRAKQETDAMPNPVYTEGVNRTTYFE